MPLKEFTLIKNINNPTWIAIVLRLLAALAVLPGVWALAGCQSLAGGPCLYEDQIGTVVVSSSGEKPEGIFSAVDTWNERSRIRQERPLPLTGAVFVEERHRYPARLSVIRKGSCVPVRLEVLSDASLMQGVLLALDEEGRETETTRQQIEQVAETFNQLKKYWPQSCLLVCGQGADKYSAEYRWDLARRYEQRFRRRFAELGIHSQCVRVVYGVLPKNMLPVSLDSVNGVQVFFALQ